MDLQGAASPNEVEETLPDRDTEEIEELGGVNTPPLLLPGWRFLTL